MRETLMLDRKVERKKLIDQLTKKDILEAVVAILLEDGRKGFTMDRVAAGAGIAKGTLYLHYDNKAELLYSAVGFCFEPLDRKIEEIIRIDQDPVLKLEQCVLAWMKYADKNKKLFNELRNELFNTQLQYMNDKESWYWIYINLFASALDDAVEAGIFRPMNTVKVAILFLNATHSLMLHRILLKTSETIEDDVSDLMSLFINGLRA
jgi:AcrR family transcriptional regulator